MALSPSNGSILEQLALKGVKPYTVSYSGGRSVSARRRSGDIGVSTVDVLFAIMSQFVPAIRNDDHVTSAERGCCLPFSAASRQTI